MMTPHDLDEEQVTLLDIIYTILRGWGSEDPADD